MPTILQQSTLGLISRRIPYRSIESASAGSPIGAEPRDRTADVVTRSHEGEQEAQRSTDEHSAHVLVQRGMPEDAVLMRTLTSFPQWVCLASILSARLDWLLRLPASAVWAVAAGSAAGVSLGVLCEWVRGPLATAAAVWVPLLASLAVQLAMGDGLRMVVSSGSLEDRTGEAGGESCDAGRGHPLERRQRQSSVRSSATGDTSGDVTRPLQSSD